MFDLTQRQIFKMKDWDGKDICRDPMRLWRRLRESSGGKMNDFLKVVNDEQADPKEQSVAIDQAVNAFTEAAEIKRFDPATGEGWTEAQAIAGIGDWNRFVNGVKKNGKMTQKSSTTIQG